LIAGETLVAIFSNGIEGQEVVGVVEAVCDRKSPFQADVGVSQDFDSLFAIDGTFEGINLFNMLEMVIYDLRSAHGF
jgi:hypothetical protein